MEKDFNFSGNISSINKDQFDLMRTCDPNRYPAFFELYGKKYKIILEKCSKK